MESQDTSATGGFLMPQWFVNGEPRPPEVPQWGERIEGVRMFDWDGEPDEYNDLRCGKLEDGRFVIGVGCDCGCGYAFIDVTDLKAWLAEE